ncbi:putative pterin-4-alpha-carbinolamine dehydratase-like [Heracleum sosnowskyi]|uniref:Pterin-4-alpha-carbinolamine dehydratase-like n=1 Tax=Heracleum sosnowskyi TaxID=360622 RepID=A0AAD8J9E9_9APIA|nr:putative pterin-4-alpha-carbinolamine dehydratase-like [Heracleum sosnowskyi]
MERRITERSVGNSVKILQRREIGSRRDRCFSLTGARERFRSIFLQEEYDTQDPLGQSATVVLPFLQRRSKVIQIVSARGIVFSLVQSGVCAAFSRDTNQRICFLNLSSDEVIQSLYYNKYSDSVITVSVLGSDYFSSLNCRTTRIEYIQRGQPDAGFLLFGSESLKRPGFVEFDDLNAKLLTFSAQDCIYKVFDLRNYTMLYSISDKDVQEIKTSPRLMMLIYTEAGSYIPLKILSIEDGSVLKSFNYHLFGRRKVDFIEQFNDKLLVKQENENLRILDVRTSQMIEISRTEYLTPSAFVFLYESHLFLTFRDRTVDVRNFRGELVTSFEDHLPWHPDSNLSNIYITSDQDLIISYFKPHFEGRAAQNAGSINISNILTGKCLAKISAGNTRLLKECKCSGRQCNLSKACRPTDIRSTVEDALKGITAIFYDEERSEIYTGKANGLLHVWSN